MIKTKSTRIISLATFLVMLLSIFNFLPILNVWAADPVTVTDENGIRTQITAGATNIIYNPAQYVTIMSNITIPAGVTLTISAGGNSLTNNAIFINNGTLINNNNNFQNYQSLTNNGTLTNNGNIYNTGVNAVLTNNASGTITNNKTLNNAQLRIIHSVMRFSPQNTNSSGQIEIPLSILTASPGTCTFNVSYSDTTGIYALSSNSVSFNISPKALTISGLSVSDKAYDTTTDASISGTPQLNGTISGDNVYLVNGIPSFVSSDSSVNPISVSFTNFTLSGTAASNYTLTQPTGITARINKADNTLVISCDNITFGETPNPQVTANTSGGNVTYE